MLVEVGLIAFSNACFEFAYEGPEEGQHGSVANLTKMFASHLRRLSKAAVVGFCAYRLLFLCCNDAFISASTPGLITNEQPKNVPVRKSNI